MEQFYNQDYFPTPDHLLDRMIEKLGRNWKHEVKHVLEPSAGAGHLIEGMKNRYMKGQEINGFWCRGSKTCDIKFDAVEIEDGKYSEWGKYKRLYGVDIKHTENGWTIDIEAPTFYSLNNAYLWFKGLVNQLNEILQEYNK